MEELGAIHKALTSLTTQVLMERCSRFTLLVQAASGVDVDVPSTVGGEKENSPPSSPPPKNFVRGGGRMCHSTIPLPLENKKNAGVGVGVIDMAFSLNTGLKLLKNQCPLVSKLMEESQILRTQYECHLIFVCFCEF